MKQFVIKVNGTAYEVEVEEVAGLTGKQNRTAAAQTAQAPVISQAASVSAKPAEATTTPKTAPVVDSGEGNPVESPMPGTIMSVAVKPGDQVTSGSVLLILEAMKMENEITAPNDGTVSSVLVKAGDTVDSGDVLVRLS